MSNESGAAEDLTGRVIVVTGANSGIGLAAAEEFARRGARLALVGRDQGRLEEAEASVRAAAGPDVPLDAFQSDFAVLADVRRLADRLGEAYPKIDVLANNAGGVFPKRVLTVDGHEQTMQTNHLAPFLLTSLLRQHLSGGRVVNTASDAHNAGKLDAANLESEGRYRPFTVYGSSKQANILFAAEAAQRWPDIASFSYHPGVVRTRFGRENLAVSLFYKFAPFLLTPQQGADTMVWLAGTPLSELDNGGYYVKRQRKSPSSPTMAAGLAERLWDASDKAVGLA